MLQQIRAHSGSLVIKIILSIIGASFFVFGIADVVRIIMATPPVAKMGKLRVSVDEYHFLYGHYRSQLLVAKAGEQALSRAADDVLDYLISSKIMAYEPERLGMLVPLSVSKNLIQGIKEFQKDGHFDGETFAKALEHTMISPKEFLSRIKQNLLQHQFLVPLTFGIALSKQYVDFLVDVMRRKRHFTIVELPDEKSEAVAVSDEKLETWLREHGTKYERPEERTIQLILLDHDSIAAGITLPAHEIDDEVNARIVNASEEREVHAVVFESASDANDAQKVVMTTKSWDEIKRKFPDAIVSAVDMSTLPPPIHEALSARDEWIPWGPVAVGRKHAIYVVTKITSIPAQTVSREAIEQELKRIKLPKKLEQRKNNIEDALACETPINDVAQKFNANVRTVAFNKNNARERLREAGVGDNVAEMVVEQAFVLENNNCDSPFFDASNNSWLIRLVGIRGKHVPPLSQVKEQVEEDYRAHCLWTKSFESLSTMFGPVQDDFSQLPIVISRAGAKLKKTEMKASRLDLMMNDSPLSKMFSAETIERLMLQKNHSISFVECSNGQPVCVIVTRASLEDAADALNPKTIERIDSARKKLAEQSQADGVPLTTDSVRGAYPVRINEKVKKTVTGADA
ncbi:MAG: SurA N-terminal domain-containing protein [Holosporales bacterium]|jgi:peptidyl-prolyl cis-trans isomerase D|nr:SurA N-terminal domain-containing protein [Holosporales bacterium]